MWTDRLLVAALLAACLVSSVSALGKIKPLLFSNYESETLYLGQDAAYCMEDEYDIDGIVFSVYPDDHIVAMSLEYPNSRIEFFGTKRNYDREKQIGAKKIGKPFLADPAAGYSLTKPRVISIGSGLKGKQLCVHIVCQGIRFSCKYKFSARRPNHGVRHVPKSYETSSKPVCGMADLHLHQYAYLGFGGNWFDSPHEGAFANQKDANIGYIPTGIHGHQQIHDSWLKRAHMNGLTLAVIPLLNNDVICFGGVKYQCNDMASIIRQARAAWRFAEKNSGWYEIALDPWHARDIIHRGKLAAVLTAEVSDLFTPSRGDWVDQLKEIHDLGVRGAFAVHEIDNKWAGAAPQMWLLEVLQFLERGHPFRRDANGLNSLGLTAEGRKLFQAFIDYNMLIDLGHLSDKAAREVVQMTESMKYPVFDGHTRFQALCNEELRGDYKEFITAEWKATVIKERRGLIGLRTEGTVFNPYVPPPGSKVPAVEDSCHGSSTSLAQQVQYGESKGMMLAFGSDLNGFAEQTGPRFGKDACPNPHPPKGRSKDSFRKEQAAKQKKPRGNEFDVKGHATVAMLPELVLDLKAIGATTSSIERSAENFLRMWERAYANNQAASSLPKNMDQPYATSCSFFAPKTTFAAPIIEPSLNSASLLKRPSHTDPDVAATITTRKNRNV